MPNVVQKIKNVSFSPNLKGALWLLGSVVLFQISYSLVKVTGQNISSVQMVFLRSLFQMALVFTRSLFTIPLAAIMLKERAGCARGIATVIGFIGRYLFGETLSLHFTVGVIIIITASVYISKRRAGDDDISATSTKEAIK